MPNMSTTTTYRLMANFEKTKTFYECFVFNNNNVLSFNGCFMNMCHETFLKPTSCIQR